MKHRLLFAWVLVAFGSCAPGSEFLDRLMDPSTSSAVFDLAVEPVRARVLKYEWAEGCRLRFAGALRIPFLEGGPAAVLLLEGRGAPCGTGLRAGGVTAPNCLSERDNPQGIVVVTADGQLMDFVLNGRARMLVIDLDGDGAADSLIRWSDSFDYSRPPFLVIHDLRRPGLPTMLSLQFNTGSKSPLIFDAELEPPELIQGRWSLAKVSTGFPDVVIETFDGDRVPRAAHFRYNPLTHLWEGPNRDTSGFWCIASDSWCGASREDLSTNAR